MGHYLFLLATAKRPIDAVRLRGLRQLVTIGIDPSDDLPAPSSTSDASPNWSFPSGNISWRLLGRIKRKLTPAKKPARKK